MDGPVEEKAATALEGMYSGLGQKRELAQAREIFAFLRQSGQGSVLTEVPSVTNGATVLDLVALYDAIAMRGGVRRVQEQGLWKDVLAELGHPFDRQTLFAISVCYKNFLYAYEQRTLGTSADSTQQPPPAAPQQKQQQQQQQQQEEGEEKQQQQQQQQQQPLELMAQQQQQEQPQAIAAPQAQHAREPSTMQFEAETNARQYGQYQRHLRQRELQQQQQLRQQRQMEQLQQERHRKMQETQARQLQEQQRFLLKQQQQQLQLQQQQQLYQQKQQQAEQRLKQQQQQQQQMMLKQQKQQQQQQHEGRPSLYQAQQQNRHSSLHPAGGRQGDGYSRSGNALKAAYNSRSRSSPANAGVSASVPRRELPRMLGSSVPSDVCAAVNTLTLETYDAAEELVLEEVPGLCDAIFDLMDKLNPAVSQVVSLAARLRTQLPKDVEATPALLDACWASADEAEGLFDGTAAGFPPPGRGALLLLLLNALRNASFVPSNERTIGHSARAVQHLVSLCSASGVEPATFSASYDLMGRVTKHIDIWGKRAAEADYEGCKWAEDSLSFLAPAHVRMAAISSSSKGGMLSPSTLEYVSSAALLFPALASCVYDEERKKVLAGLAIISKLAQVDHNTEAFNRAPDSFLERLGELLLIPQQGCDVLAPTVNVSSLEWLEHNGRVLHPSLAGVDSEVRDSSLEVMSLLAGLSDNLRTRLGAVPGCIHSLVRLAISSTGGFRADSQARRMASLTLTALASVEINHARIKPLHAEVLVAAARDAHAAELLLNGLKSVFPAA